MRLTLDVLNNLKTQVLKIIQLAAYHFFLLKQKIYQLSYLASQLSFSVLQLVFHLQVQAQNIIEMRIWDPIPVSMDMSSSIYSLSMPCNGVPTDLPPAKIPPQIGNLPPVLKFLNPPLVLKISTPPPPSNCKRLLLHFSNMATSNKHMFIFLKLL